MPPKPVKQKSFAVVDFYDESNVAVVPSSWLEFKGQQVSCFWPSGPGCSELQKKQESIPKPEWSKHPVRILKYYSDFATAKANEKTVQVQSDLESEDNRTPVNAVKRKITKSKGTSKKRLDFSDSGEEGDSSSCDDKSNDKNDKLTLDGSVAEFHRPLNSPSSAEKATALLVQTANNLDEPVPDTADDFPLSDNNVLQQQQLQQPLVLTVDDSAVLALTDEFKRFEKVVLAKLLELKIEIDHISNAVGAAGSVSVEAGITLPDLPLKTTGDVTALDAWIGESDQNRKTLVRHMQSIGGSDYRNAASRILGKLLSPLLQTSFTLTGVRTNKSAFNKLKLFQVVIDSVKQIPSCSSCDDKSIEKAIGDWFRNANERVHGRRKSVQDGHQQTHQEEED